MSLPFPADLAKCSISAILDMGVDPVTFNPWFTFSALTERLTVRTVGFVHMRVSRAWEDRFSDDTDVLEVRCERRLLSADDIVGYAWGEAILEAMLELTVLTISGQMNLVIVCDSIETVIEP